jgi:hypothetical protein
MPVQGEKVLIKVPNIKAGYYFLTGRQYRSDDGILYNYTLHNKHGHQLKPTKRGHRKMLCFLFPRTAGRPKMEDLHRVFAFNYKKCNWKPLAWSKDVDVHHRAKPKRKPWSNCTWQNMSVWTRVVHKQWHKKHG